MFYNNKTIIINLSLKDNIFHTEVLKNALFGRLPEIVFWHIPSKVYKKVAPFFRIRKPCVGSINKEKVASQEAETGIMKLLVERPSVKVRSKGLVLVQFQKPYL